MLKYHGGGIGSCQTARLLCLLNHFSKKYAPTSLEVML